MEIMETISGARDAITVKRVYGDPYERNGIVVIPAAAVVGGGGGGGGEQDGQAGKRWRIRAARQASGRLRDPGR